MVLSRSLTMPMDRAQKRTKQKDRIENKRGEPLITASKLSIFYDTVQAVKDVSLSIKRQGITALIGPSGCGKSTFLRTLNRMNDGIPKFRVEGRLCVDGQDIYAPFVDPIALRKGMGMVFQRPNPFPLSVFDNVAWALRPQRRKKKDLEELVILSLQRAGLFSEVKNRLKDPAFTLSGGQQQRLCIARAIALEPAILLMDEPTSALDPTSTRIIEELMLELKARYTVLLVSHNMEQALRVADDTAFFLSGELIEHAPTTVLFSTPKEKATEDYITGRFG